MRVLIPHGKTTRFIGKIEEGIFKKSVNKSIHLFRTLNAWGIDSEMFDGVISRRANVGIQVHDQDTGYYYRTNVRTFAHFGIRKMPEYGDHREQIFLLLDYFTRLKFSPQEEIKEPCLSVLKFQNPEKYEEKQVTLF